MILYGSSGIGEPEYRGAVYSADHASLGLGLWPMDYDVFADDPADAPAVELALEYDPAPDPVRWAAIPPWLLAVGVAAWALNRYGG